MTDVARAQLLLRGDATCVAVKGDAVCRSERRGIAPMLGWIADGTDLWGYSVADRIVGKAAAMLFVKAGIAAVYAEVLSEAGRGLLEAHGIPVTGGTVVEQIINRQGTGVCPMEQTVAGIDGVDEAYEALCRKVESLKKGGPR